jgi:hypothetical protein
VVHKFGNKCADYKNPERKFKFGLNMRVSLSVTTAASVSEDLARLRGDRRSLEFRQGNKCKGKRKLTEIKRKKENGKEVHNPDTLRIFWQ